MVSVLLLCFMTAKYVLQGTVRFVGIVLCNITQVRRTPARPRPTGPVSLTDYADRHGDGPCHPSPPQAHFVRASVSHTDISSAHPFGQSGTHALALARSLHSAHWAYTQRLSTQILRTHTNTHTTRATRHRPPNNACWVNVTRGSR